MDIPVFKLEGIVKTKNEMSDFEGPLALILQLLSKDKIEIRDISISLILEQYLEYLDEMAELDLDIASEFVAMASHLTYIKTKVLLSGGEEITELEQLMSSLEELRRGDVYMQIKTVAETFSEMYIVSGTMMAGPPEYLPPCEQYRYVHNRNDLLEAIFRVIGREESKISSINPRAPVYPLRIVFSIEEKVSQILERLKVYGNMPVAALFSESGSRSELVATLIAVLELCKVGSVLLMGSADDMTLTYTGTGRMPELMQEEM
ncbi:MAG: segregation/condensation protein A [Oscillospiraceae bacterium]|jgi:segregation and condensation protein A|nr:segregation/condensation protein A [Oscillospiraceae bacterium]